MRAWPKRLSSRNSRRCEPPASCQGGSRIPAGGRFFLYLKGTFSALMRDDFCCGAVPAGFNMVGRSYLARQATALLRFASSTKNPQLAAVLVEKAASLKSQVDEAPPASDLSPRAPDVELPAKCLQPWSLPRAAPDVSLVAASDYWLDLTRQSSLNPQPRAFSSEVDTGPREENASK